MDLLTENTEKSRIVLQITPEDLINNQINAYELFTIVGLYSKHFEEYVDTELFENLVQKGFVEQTKFQTKLSKKGLLFIRKLTQINVPIKEKKKVLGQTVSKTEGADEEFVKKFRSLFKGTKVGAMGSEKLVSLKLARFMKEYPRATEDIIMEAARRYINNLDSYRYIQQADYFIYKRDVYTQEESSRLSTYVDEVLANPNNDEDDWTVNII